MEQCTVLFGIWNYTYFWNFLREKHVKDLPAKLSKEAEISMDLIQYKLSNTVLDTRQYRIESELCHWDWNERPTAHTTRGDSGHRAICKWFEAPVPKNMTCKYKTLALNLYNVLLEEAIWSTMQYISSHTRRSPERNENFKSLTYGGLPALRKYLHVA